MKKLKIFPTVMAGLLAVTLVTEFYSNDITKKEFLVPDNGIEIPVDKEANEPTGKKKN